MSLNYEKKRMVKTQHKLNSKNLDFRNFQNFKSGGSIREILNFKKVPEECNQQKYDIEIKYIFVIYYLKYTKEIMYNVLIVYKNI